jgi:hypothetical protein
MYKGILSNLLYTLIIGLIITACGSSKPTSGKVVDDYISEAKICADVNNNKLADDGKENCLQTTSQGGYKFSKKRTELLVVTGGTDIGTGKEFKGILFAPPESSVVTPLTTLVVSVQEEGNKSLEEAQEIVKKNLGLSETKVNLTTFDPLFQLQFEKDTTKKEIAQKVLAQQTNIQIILTITATTITAVSKDIQEQHVTIEASNQIAQLILNNSTEESSSTINSQANIETIIESTALKTFNSNKQEDKEALASIENIKTIVAKQTEEITKNTIIAITTTPIDSEEESGLNIIKESNIGILLVTNNKTGSIQDNIKNSISTGNSRLLESIDIQNEIEHMKDEIIERREVDKKDEEENKKTGAEGGSL